jgi:hypothetical protein
MSNRFRKSFSAVPYTIFTPDIDLDVVNGVHRVSDVYNGTTTSDVTVEAVPAPGGALSADLQPSTEAPAPVITETRYRQKRSTTEPSERVSQFEGLVSVGRY